jgi:hypothetical protein
MDTSSADGYILLQALGSLVVRFSALEEFLRDAIVMASGSRNPAVRILTSRLPFKTLVEKFGAVCIEFGPVYGSPEEIKQFCGLLDKINDDRNELTHSVWPSEPSDAPYIRYKMSADRKKGLMMNVREVSAAEVDALVARIVAAETKLLEIAIGPIKPKDMQADNT